MRFFPLFKMVPHLFQLIRWSTFQGTFLSQFILQSLPGRLNSISKPSRLYPDVSCLKYFKLSVPTFDPKFESDVHHPAQLLKLSLFNFPLHLHIKLITQIVKIHICYSLFHHYLSEMSQFCNLILVVWFLDIFIKTRARMSKRSFYLLSIHHFELANYNTVDL